MGKKNWIPFVILCILLAAAILYVVFNHHGNEIFHNAYLV